MLSHLRIRCPILPDYLDLIDLRAELEQELKDMGLNPIMSDRPSSKFEVLPDENSIETCLVNVKKSNIFIVILSQRYGPKLGGCGFPDLSATHLEYRTAKEINIPIFMYVRDRLKAEYEIWRKNRSQNITLQWIKKDYESIFAFLEEHKNLVGTKKNSNWFWEFSNSIELKQRIRRDLKIFSGRAILRHLLEKGKVAYLIPTVYKWEVDLNKTAIKCFLNIQNVGTASALEPNVTLYYENEGNKEKKQINTIMPQHQAKLKIEVEIPINIINLRRPNPNIIYECEYTTPEGYRIADVSRFSFIWKWIQSSRDRISESHNSQYLGKKYLHSDGVQIL